MLFRFLAHIRFLLNSTNHHGVHSPFIFKYVTKGLYSTQGFKTTKSLNIVLKTLLFFKIKRVQLITKNGATKDLILRHNKDISFVAASEEFMYWEQPSATLIKHQITDNKHLAPTSILFIDNIHNSKESEILWETVKDLEIVTVTIDLFYAGIVFFRKEQAKEHFKIRF
ncbi:hypothetical protein SAMN04487911_102133 [Arenibacter nanhaiticus]|uniref:Uncharacterized protein n=1 Tax=Arenibacter nanhaiticus TaxID=558155 RepID=A0A1M6BBI6_9FLAO|nr:hypothetical protein [Arenibacter nanhaiticus]SHI46075.1 hypothetical protein SAMN04487911_102133 [Arenibacter nanhaiticus]